MHLLIWTMHIPMRAYNSILCDCLSENPPSLHLPVIWEIATILNIKFKIVFVLYWTCICIGLASSLRIIIFYLLAFVWQVDNGGFSILFDDLFMEFVNIGPAYIRGWVGGALGWGGWWQKLKQRSKMTQIVEFRLAMTCIHVPTKGQ